MVFRWVNSRLWSHLGGFGRDKAWFERVFPCSCAYLGRGKRRKEGRKLELRYEQRELRRNCTFGIEMCGIWKLNVLEVAKQSRKHTSAVLHVITTTKFIEIMLPSRMWRHFVVKHGGKFND
jgi:hypothetical protein